MSAYKRLFIWVEGDDDVRFFESIIAPRFELYYDNVQVRAYSCMKGDKLDAFLHSISAMGADYIVVADMDEAPCYTRAKASLSRKVPRCATAPVVIIKQEVEGWYLAGLTPAIQKKLKLNPYGDTNAITKESFNETLPRHASRKDIMVDMLKNFDILAAKAASESFDYIMSKYKL